MTDKCIECEKLRTKIDYYIIKTNQLLDDIEILKEWQSANQPTGICETCTAKSVEDMYKYKIALDEIEKIINSPCISTISSCIECKCSSCLYKQVLNIINKAKEQ